MIPLKILSGKKVMLFPFADCDFEDWANLLKHEGEAMGQSFFRTFDAYLQFTMAQIACGAWQIWAVETSNLGKEKNKKIGFIALHSYNEVNQSVSIQGLMNKEIVKGLIPLLKVKEKFTFAEDALRVMLEHLKNSSIHRIEAECFESNKPPRLLLEKIGFKKEGKLADAGKKNDKFENIIVYGLITEHKDAKKNDAEKSISAERRLRTAGVQ